MNLYKNLENNSVFSGLFEHEKYLSFDNKIGVSNKHSIG